MKKVFFIFFMITAIYADDLVFGYLQNGIEWTEKKLDEKLTEKNYWKEFLKNKDLQFGFISKYTSILVCNKNKSELDLYKLQNNKYQHIKKYHAYTGRNKGDKQNEGDFRTPVGIYSLTQKLSNVDPFYGPLAFVTSYPNLFDRYEGKSGHGIWIHGLPLNQKRDEWTKGCIAIDNSNIECLNNTIKLDNTILLIYENKQEIQTDTDIYAEILSELFKWRKAWKYSNLDKYLSFYDHENFKKSDGKNFNQFKDYKRQVFGRKQKKEIIFRDINIIPYPNKKNIYQITFYEIYNTKSYSYKGNKELLIRFENNNIKIFSEK